MNSRSFSLAAIGVCACWAWLPSFAGEERIDRARLVARHAVRLDAPDRLSPLSVGNGDFAFTVDITGLQTFPDFHADKGIPLGTQANFAWHEFANPQNFQLGDSFLEYPFHGRQVSYLDRDPDGKSRAGIEPARARASTAYFRENPHRFDLGRLGWVCRDANGKWVAPAMQQLSGFRQELDLWTGHIHSRFSWDGTPVKIVTTTAPDSATIALSVEIEGTPKQPIGLQLAFPYTSGGWRESADWNADDKHHTGKSSPNPGAARFTRTLSGKDADKRWHVDWHWSGDCALENAGRHVFVVPLGGAGRLTSTLRFHPALAASEDATLPRMPDFNSVSAAMRKSREAFWLDGACVELADSRDPRGRELERRIVLSQYLTAVHCSGHLPPQETGLIFNSWHGKFHLEMHWWHAAQFALWGRHALLARGMDYYHRILPVARATARQQGFAGARWPKMTGPEGRESPSGIGVFLIWQQPHPVYLAELLYRANPNKETLEKWYSVVEASAEFMVDFAQRDPATGRYVLGPTVIPAQECYRPQMGQTTNPTFELAYWSWAVNTANIWRERLGLPPDPRWADVAAKMAPPTIREGLYTAIACPPYTRNIDHPSMLMAYGFVPPTPMVEPVIMRKTLGHVLETWDWPDTWGWDFPMTAMTAARVGRPDQAIQALFLDSPKNRWLPNGHNWQDDRLPVYLPGNGALLYAVAMMAAGWDGSPGGNAPGFPSDGSWTVRHEGLRPAP